MAAVAALTGVMPVEGASPHRGSGPDAACRRRLRPVAWLRRALRGAQAVAEERPKAVAPEDDDEVDDASYDGSPIDAADACSFGNLPEHLLERVFSHLRGSNRKHHFAICGVNQQWRRLGQAMFFSRPWEVAHLICHPTQLFCLSPRHVAGSRSGLLKCFVRRENGTGGKRFTLHIGKDASQPQRSRFLLAAKQGGRDEVLLFLNSRCEGPPCARLRCNMFATQYKLTLAEELQLEPACGTRSQVAPAPCEAAAASPAALCRGTVSRLSSWGAEAAAEAAVAAATAAARRREAAAAGGGAADAEELGVDCFAELQYQARVKGFMQPRRMRVLLPHPSQLFFDQALPHLSRRQSEVERAGGGGSPADAGPAARDVPAPGTPSSSRFVRLLSRRNSGGGRGGPRAPRAAPSDPSLEPIVLQNKAPHWNEGLRCWCLNFRGRVKLASVKNFQLVRADDPTERVVMQFGKAEQDAFILDFNPTVLTALGAFGLVLSTFETRLFL